MNLTSTAFQNGEMLPELYTANGENKNPPLQISDAPEGTESFVLTLTDPDAPAGTFIHWLVWNIPGNSAEIPEDMLPDGSIEGTNSANQIGYYGAKPPAGETHRYIFTLYALSIPSLELDSSVEWEYLVGAIDDYIIEETSLVGMYGK